MTLLYLPIWIDSPETTFPELRSFLVGQKVMEGHSLYAEIIDSVPPLAGWWNGITNFIFGRSLTGRHIVAFIILFLQSAFFGITLINKKTFAENTYIPSLLFSILSFLSFDISSLSAELPAFGFILLTLNNLLKEIEFREQRDDTIFNLGIFISIASLFSFSYTIYLPGCILILVIFTRSSARRYLLMILGFLLPHLILITIYYYNDSLSRLFEYYYFENFKFNSASLMTAKGLLMLSALPLFYLFISLFVLNREGRLTKYQSQIFQAMFIWFIVAFGQLFFAENLRPQSLLPLIPPASFFLAHFLLVIRRVKFAEINFWILFIGVITMSFLTRYSIIDHVDYDKLFVAKNLSKVSNKRVLVLDNTPGLYLQNKIGSTFTNWGIAKNIFEKPDYYENVILVNRLLENDLPEIIIDPKDLMEGFFKRLPTLKSKYQKSEEGYQLISN